MSEDKTITPGEETNVTDTKTDNRPETVPYSTFTDVRKEGKVAKERVAALEAELAVFDKAKADKIEADQIAKGDYETALNKYKTENTALQAVADEYTAYKETQVATLIEQLPENKRTFAEGMNLKKLTDFVALEKDNKLTPREDGAPSARDGKFGGYDNIVDFAKNDAAGYAEYKKSKSPRRSINPFRST